MSALRQPYDDKIVHLKTKIEELERRLGRWQDTSMPAYRRTIEVKQRYEMELEKVLRLQESASQLTAMNSASPAVLGANAARRNIRGDRDPEVSARRTELRNMLRGGHPPYAKDVCKRWDSARLRVPENWQEKGFKTWQEAYSDPRMKPNVKKLISTDKSRIQPRR